MDDWDAARARDWADYNADRAEHELRPLAVAAMRHAGRGAGRLAVDLGAGAGVECEAFLNAGWRVLALDGDPTTVDRIRARGAGREGLGVRTVRFGELTELPPCDLVYSGYALPYAFDALPTVLDAVRRALRPGGWFAAHLFGDRDSALADGDKAMLLTRDDVERWLDGWDVVQFDEEDGVGPCFGGTKHWHVFHIIARVPGA